MSSKDSQGGSEGYSPDHKGKASHSHPQTHPEEMGVFLYNLASPDMPRPHHTLTHSRLSRQ